MLNYTRTGLVLYGVIIQNKTFLVQVRRTQVWSCFSASGVGNLVKPYEIIKAEESDFDPLCNTIWKMSDWEWLHLAS